MVPQHIIGRLYVGDNNSFERIAHREGWSALRCCKFGPGGHKDILKYTTQAAPNGPDKYIATKGDNLMAMNILDLDDPNFINFDMIKSGLDFIKSRIEVGDRVLIACNSGHSRGPTTALMYLRSIGEMPHGFVQSEKVYRTLYPDYNPGIGLRQFAKNYWDELKNLEIKEDGKA